MDETETEKRIRQVFDDFNRYCGGPDGDVLVVMEALAVFYDDRTNMRDMQSARIALLQAVGALVGGE